MPEHPGPPRNKDFKFRVAVLLSLLILAPAVAAGITVWFHRTPDSPTLGDWGDYIGGVASAIALVWIVTAYLQQNQELRHQLREFSASVEAQKQQAEATQESVRLVSEASIRLASMTHPSAGPDHPPSSPAFRHSRVTMLPDRAAVTLTLTGARATRVTATCEPPLTIHQTDPASLIEVGKDFTVTLTTAPTPSPAPPQPGPPPLPPTFAFDLHFLDDSARAYTQHVRVNAKARTSHPDPPLPSPHAT